MGLSLEQLESSELWTFQFRPCTKQNYSDLSTSQTYNTMLHVYIVNRKPGKHERHTTMPRFMFKVHDPAQPQIVLGSLHYAWITYYTTRFYWLVPRSEVNKYCVLCTKENKSIQHHSFNNALHEFNESLFSRTGFLIIVICICSLDPFLLDLTTKCQC